MIIKRIFVLSIFYILSIFGKFNNFYSQNVDSLITVTSGLDLSSEKAYNLLEIATLFEIKSDYLLAIDYSTKSAIAFEEIDDVNGMALAFLAKGISLTRLNQFDNANRSIQNAFDLFVKTNNNFGVAKTQLALSSVYLWDNRSIENNLKAKELLFEASIYFSDNLEYTYLAKAYFNFGLLYDNEGDVVKVLHYYYKAIELYRNTELVEQNNANLNFLAAAYANSGLAYMLAAEYDLAIDYFLKAIDYLPELSNQSNRVIMLNNLSYMYLKLHRWNECLDICYQSMSVATKIDNPFRKIDASLCLGRYHLKHGDLDSAFYFIKAADKLQLIYDNMESDFSLKGEYYLKTGDLDKAEQRFLKIVNGELQSWYQDNLLNAWNGLAQVYKLKKDYVRYIHALEKAKANEDSLYLITHIPPVSLSETKHEQALSLKEKLRHEEAAAVKLKERNFLQYSGALSLIIVLFILMSFTIRMNLPAIVIKGGIFLTVLTLFEFTLVYFDPKIEILTNSEPVLKLLVNVCIAALIFPLHNFIEHKMYASNKKK